MTASSLIEFLDFLSIITNNKLTMKKSGQRKFLGGAQVTISSLFVIPSKYESIIS